MSTFTLNSITVQGLNVIAKLVAGSTLQFTRIAVGDGAMPSDKTPLTVTDLTKKLFDVDINSVKNNGNGSATVTGIFSNADRETGFFYRELGLFAKDPDTQAEILYCYGNAGADAEWISPSGASSVIEKEVKIVTLIGNAETVTAEIKSGIYATQEEVEAALALKADLDAEAEDGGRVLASQMRFDADQTLYVDAAAAEGGDGSEAKPFKTIQAAINARYKGAAVIFIKIKAGTYAENISVPRSPGTTWRITREGTGTVNINTAIVDNCTYVLFDNLTFTGPATDNSTIIYVANTASAHFNAVTINGAANSTGVNFSTSRGIMRNCSINNCGLAIAATDGAYLDLKNNGGTGNTRALQADGALIICDYYVPAATTPYEKVNGGVISVLGGTSTFPSNYTPAYSLGDFSDAQALKTALLAEFGALGIGEKRDCWFACNIAAGFGPFETGQRMQCSIIKNTNSGSGYGIILFYSHHNAPAAFMQIQDGAFAQAVPVKFITNNDVATTQSPGIVQLAAETDELNPTAAKALAPANVYKLCNFRIISTAYEVGDVVACAYHADLQLKCTQAGTTSAEPLNTADVTAGQEITDGGVKWTVEQVGLVKTVNGQKPDAGGNVQIDTGGVKTINGMPPDDMGDIDITKLFPLWHNDDGNGNDGEFAPAEDTTISGIKNYTSVNIPIGVTVTVDKFTHIKCKGNVEINGTLKAIGGAGGAISSAGESGYFATGGTGGTANVCRPGAGGGALEAAAGVTGVTAVLEYLKTENTALTNIYSAGGGGGDWEEQHRGNPGVGGDGGGGVLIVCKNFAVSGNIDASGENGEDGHSPYGAGGGGGGGGLVFVVCNDSNVTGTISVNGGTGGLRAWGNWANGTGSKGADGASFIKER